MTKKLISVIIVFTFIFSNSAFAFSDGALRATAVAERQAAPSSSKRLNLEESEPIVAILNRFDTTGQVFEAGRNCAVEVITSGNINATYRIDAVDPKDPLSPPKPMFIIQKIGPTFDAGAIRVNLPKFEEAQRRARARGILPEWWEEIKFFRSKDANAEDIFYQDTAGSYWRVMNFIDVVNTPDGVILNSLDEIPRKMPGATKEEIATAIGEGIATFNAMINTVPPEGWEYPLVGFHNTLFHLNYLIDIAEHHKARFRSLSNKASAGTPPPGHKDAVSYKPEVIGGYDDGKNRVDRLLAEFKKRQALATALDAAGFGIAHNDTKINNFVFKRGKDGKWHVACLIDLDTLQAGRLLDDLGDALRSAANTAGEMPKNINDVKIDKEVLTKIIVGYLKMIEKTYGHERAMELKKYALIACKVYFYELGARFFADSLVGNEYFKLNPRQEGYRPDLNLYRGEVQMQALREFEKIENELSSEIDIELLREKIADGIVTQEDFIAAAKQIAPWFSTISNMPLKTLTDSGIPDKQMTPLVIELIRIIAADKKLDANRGRSTPLNNLIKILIGNKDYINQLPRDKRQEVLTALEALRLDGSQIGLVNTMAGDAKKAIEQVVVAAPAAPAMPNPAVLAAV